MLLTGERERLEGCLGSPAPLAGGVKKPRGWGISPTATAVQSSTRYTAATALGEPSLGQGFVC